MDPKVLKIRRQFVDFFSIEPDGHRILEGFDPDSPTFSPDIRPDLILSIRHDGRVFNLTFWEDDWHEYEVPPEVTTGQFFFDFFFKVMKDKEDIPFFEASINECRVGPSLAFLMMRDWYLMDLPAKRIEKKFKPFLFGPWE